MLNPEIENPPVVTPAGWDDRFEPFPSGPMLGTEQPCGCYIRLGDYEPILCGEHLAELNNRPKVSEKNTQEPCDTCSGYGCAECSIEPAGGDL